MGKTVVLLYQDGGICAVLFVANFNDDFCWAFAAAERDWRKTDGGFGPGYGTFVMEHLAGHGYQVSINEDFETYQTCL